MTAKSTNESPLLDTINSPEDLRRLKQDAHMDELRSKIGLALARQPNLAPDDQRADETQAIAAVGQQTIHLVGGITALARKAETLV